MKKYAGCYLFAFCYCILTLLVSHNPFFWDTIQLASKHAHWFYENGFGNLIFPNELDSGNHPTFGIYLAATWKIFGKSLPVSHFAMLPFLIGIVFQLQALVRKFFPPTTFIQIGIILVVLIEPTLLGQSVLVSPDIVLVFFYLLCINAVLSQNRLLLAVALIGLANISMRGSMMVLAVLICDLVLTSAYFKPDRAIPLMKTVPAYIPAIIIICTWYLYHYYQTGWIGYHSRSPWQGSFSMVSNIREFYQSVKMLLYVLFDYGKIVVWLILGIILFTKFKQKTVFDAKLKQLLILFIVPLIILCPTKLFYVGLMQSRYYLPVFIFLIMLTLYLIIHLQSRIYGYILYGLVFLSLFTGHFWVYPERISQNWDGTLAHLPYYDLRKKMINYIDEQNIPYISIGSEFPNLSKFKFTDLSDDTGAFAPKNLDKNKYVFYSNVFNGFTVDELEALHSKWIMEKKFSSWNVYVKLYKNPLMDSNLSLDN